MTLYNPPQSKTELLTRYALGGRYFANTELPDRTDLQHVDLSGAVFDGAILSDIDFQFANLTGVSFRDANVKCSDFRSANLRGVSFEGAAVEAVLLNGANLEDIRIDGATYCGYTLRQCDLDTWLESLTR
jgi:uncharacterized protein YjbI with pentapeptide repeats